jgi:hypothetical protein
LHIFLILLILLFFSHYSLAIIENDLPNDTVEHLNFVPAPSDSSAANLTPPANHRHKSILDVLDENSPTTEFIRLTSSTNTSLSIEQQNETKKSDNNEDVKKTNISSSIGPATSSQSPSSAHHYKPMSLASTQTYFKTIQQQQRSSSPNIQNVQTIILNDNDLPRPRTSSLKHGEKKDTITAVRFIGKDENGRETKETYL